jgi:hypothetical protein
MTFVASAFSDNVFLLDCNVVILQKKIYVVVLFSGVIEVVLREERHVAAGGVDAVCAWRATHGGNARSPR